MFQRAMLILLLSGFAGCQESTIHANLEIAELVVDAEIDSFVREFRAGEIKVNGNLIVRNKSEYLINYSNVRLHLRIVGAGSRRTYVDGVGSNFVDQGPIEINPGEKLEFAAYWIFPDSVEGPLLEHNVSLHLVIVD